MKHEPARWKADYDRDGYVVVDDAVDAQTLATLRADIEKITDDPRRLPPHLLRHLDFEQDFVRRQPEMNDLSGAQVGDAVRNIMELPLFAPQFAELIVYPPVLDVLEALFGSGEFSFNNYKCIIKAARVSSHFPWHRDLPYVHHTTPNLITAMICLDDMTQANGATVVIPGSHRSPYELVSDADMDIPPDKLPPGPRVPVLCAAGSLVLFHVNIIHGGAANRSEHPRRNVISIWAGPDAYPTGAARFAYHGLMPRSTDPARRRQVELAFPGRGR